VRRSKLRSDVVRATSLTQMDKISGLLVVARDGGEARWRFPSLQFRAAWYDKEFDRRNARSRAAREDVRPLIAGKADTMPANSRLSFVTVFHHPIGTPSSVRAKALILVGKSTVCLSRFRVATSK
jgi:hypothetical protein